MTSPEGATEPAMDVDPVSDQERVDGILAQTRVDVGDAGAARVAEVLRQRFADAGIPVSADRLASLADGVASSN